MYMPTNTSRSMLEKAKRPGDLRRSTFSWCRSTRISASSAARDRKRPAKAHQISLQRSIKAASINRFARAYQPTLVSGRDSEIESENLTLACRNATLNMTTLLQERGFSREQAYVICSVAVDLRISNVVDAPNFVVSALLPEMIFGRN